MNETPEYDKNQLSEEAIVKAIESARARARQAERERTELDRAIAAAREEERLLQRLLDVRRGSAQSEAAEAVVPAMSPEHDAGTAVLSRDRKGAAAERHQFASTPASLNGRSRHPAVQAVIDELATAGRPLHISELMRLLRERGVSIPGAGAQANLIAHLRRDARLIRTSRGMYGLSGWGLESIVPTPKVRRQRRRRVRATAK